MSKPKIFLIEENNDARPVFRNLLKNRGYQLALAIDKEDALERVSHENFDVDLIIINLCGIPPEEMLDFAANLSRLADLKVPIVAIAAEFDSKMEGTNERVNENEYIAYLEDGEQLFALLEGLLPDYSGIYSHN